MDHTNRFKRLRLTRVETTQLTYDVELDWSDDHSDDHSGDYVWKARVVAGMELIVTRGELDTREIAAIDVRKLREVKNLVVVL